MQRLHSLNGCHRKCLVMQSSAGAQLQSGPLEELLPETSVLHANQELFAEMDKVRPEICLTVLDA